MKNTRLSGNILIVTVSEKVGHRIAGLVDRSLYSSVSFARTGSETRRLLRSRRFDLIVINTPLSDEFGHELASDISGQYSCGVILLAAADVYEEVCDLVRESGVLTLSRPLSAQLFHQTVRLGLAEAARLAGWEQEMNRLKQKLEESRLIGRAKCLLIEERSLTEEEAHHYLEKEAMNQRTSLRNIAEEIIRRYE